MNLPTKLLIPALAAVVSISMFCPADGQEKQLPPLQQSGKTSEPAVTRVYDIRDLLAPTHEFPVSTSAYARSFLSPAGQSVSYAGMTVPPQQANQLFGVGGGAEVNAAAAETKNLTNELIKLILDSVSPDSWKDMGGTIGVIHELKGMFVITQTEANHKKIAQLFSDLSREQGGMVRVTADWVLLNSSDASKLTKAGSDEALAPVDPSVLQNLPAGARHFSGQTLSRNGQTVYVISGMDRSIVTSAIPVVSTGVAAYSTDVSTVGGGIALEVNPRVNWDTKSAVVTLFSTFSDPAKVANDTVTVGGATTQPGGTQLTLISPAAGFQPFSRLVQDLRTTVRVPLGASIIAGTMTLNPQTQLEGGAEQQLVLILKVTASK
jgi:hypothetical protein